MLRIFLLLAIFVMHNSKAAEWINIPVSNIGSFQIVKANNPAGQPAGFYLANKGNFATTSICSRKDFIVITDPEFAEQALSVVMFAIGAQKNLSFYIDTGACVYNGPVASIVTLQN